MLIRLYLRKYGSFRIAGETVGPSLYNIFTKLSNQDVVTCQLDSLCFQTDRWPLTGVLIIHKIKNYTNGNIVQIKFDQFT